MLSAPDLPLATPRLTLRPLHEGDTDALFALFADPRVMRYWSTAPWTSIEAAREMIARDTDATADTSYLRLGLQRRDNGAFVGTCTLFAIHAPSRRAEMGYALAAAEWGRGLMHEALVALLDHGFDALDLNRVEADIDPRNGSSAATLQRLGFAKEGVLRERWIVAGEVSDSALYGLVRRVWTARRAGVATAGDR